MGTLAIVMGWIIAIFFGGLALIILYFIITGKINLKKLICEPNGDASMSRLQFLIFTFVIAISLYLIIVGKDPPEFPQSIPIEILILLGISSGSYVLSKSIGKKK